MRKRIRWMFVITLVLGICVATGFTKIPSKIENAQNQVVKEDGELLLVEEKAPLSYDTVETENTHQTISNEQVTDLNNNEENTIGEKLTEEDKKVKLEISKHIDTRVDFRYNKKQLIQHQEETLSFYGIEDFQGRKELVAYKNDLGDEFLYKFDTGKLFLARMNSKVVKKSEKSIDIKTAQNTAQNYVSDNSVIDELILSLSQEVSEGYFFVYSKCILGYKTNATFEIIIGFDNNIVYFRNNTDAFKNNVENINESLIEQKVQEFISNYDGNNEEIRDISISIEEGEKIYLVIVVSNNATGTTKEFLSEITG